MTEQASAPATDLDSLRLFVRYDEGTGPIIVLLHGINADAADWRPVIDTIGPNFRCVAVDLLGFGESPKPLDIDYSADDHSVVLHNTLATLGIAEPYVLVGYSLGGDIAVRYAATWPDEIRRLFLLSAPFYLPPEAYSSKGFAGQIVQALTMRWAWAAVAKGKRDDSALYDLMSGRAENFAKQFLRTGDVPKHWDIMSKNLVNCISAATFVDDLPKLDMPTVFALGIRDPIVRPDQTPALQRLKPDMEIRRIVGLAADHLLLIEVPERIGQEIIADEPGPLHVAWRGGAGEPLMLLAGPEGAETWRPAAEALSAENDVAVVDLLGFGSSPAPQSARYDIGDHVAGVAATASKLWGSRQFAVAGHELGGTVALGVAAGLGDRVTRAVAFSPLVRTPGLDAEASFRSPVTAQQLAARDELATLARDERARSVAGEALERRIIPLYKSLGNTALATDPAPLVARASAKVRLVLPTEDADAPRAWARTLATAGRLELSEPAGGSDLVLDRPGIAVAEIAPELAVRAGELASARRRHRDTPNLNDLVRSIDLRFMIRGLLWIALSLVLLTPIRIPAIWIARGFAAWVAFSAVSTIIGAFGLRRDGKAWLPFALIGLVGVLFAAYLAAEQTLAVKLFAWFVFVWVVWSAFSDIYVARKVSKAPVPIWTLWLKGLTALLIVIAALFVSPQAGAKLLRLALGTYFLISGASLLLYGWQRWRGASKRVAAMTARKPKPQSV